MAESDCTPLAATIAKLSLNLAESPGFDSLDAVADEIGRQLPGITRNDVVDAMVLYLRQERSETTDGLRKQLRKVKDEARTDAKLRRRIDQLQRRVDAGLLDDRPRRRREVSESIKALRRVRDELRAEAELESRIKDLEARIARGEQGTPAKRQTPKLDTERLRTLRERRDALQKQLRRKPSRRAVREAQGDQKPKRDPIERQRAEIEATIADLQRQIDTREFQDPQPRKTRPVPEDIAALRQQRDDLRKERDLLRRIGEIQQEIDTGEFREPQGREPKPSTETVERMRQERKDLMRERDLRRQIDEMLAQLRDGTFAPTDRQEVQVSEEVERLMFERSRLRRQINERIRALKPRGPWEWIAEPLNLTRSLLASFDLSSWLRQGGFIALGNPVRGARALGSGLRALVSERSMIEIDEEIRSRPNALLYDRAKLHLSETGTDTRFSKQEENFMSRLASKIPGIKQSERGFVTLLNRLRADTFDALVETLAINGEPTLEEAKAIANFVNVATGRGNMSRVEPAANTLNTFFFAPRYAVSRFQLLLGQPAWQGNARTRKLVVKEYAKYAMGFAVVTAMMLQAMEFDDEDNELELDPRSSDFMKFKFGRTRMDWGSGLLQPLVLISRLVTGETKTTVSQEVRPIRGQDLPYGQDDTFGLLARFLRGKLSPGVGLAVDLSSGTNIVGDPVTVSTPEGAKNVAIRALVPISIQEMPATFEEQGVPKGISMTVMEMLGVGLGTYGPRENEERLQIDEALQALDGDASPVEVLDQVATPLRRIAAGDDDLEPAAQADYRRDNAQMLAMQRQVARIRRRIRDLEDRGVAAETIDRLAAETLESVRQQMAELDEEPAAVSAGDP